MIILLPLLTLLTTILAHNIQLRAHSRECFHETLHTDDKMTVSFQVGDREFGGSGNLDIDFWVTNPQGGYQFHERSVSYGDHSFTAKSDGKYLYCFSNEHWSANTKEVSFNVHGIVYVPESEAAQDPLDKEGKPPSLPPLELPPSRTVFLTFFFEIIVRALSDLVASVKDEQAYIVIRERTHRNTAESTNARVKWWSMFQVIILVGEGVFQVWWIKRFFEVKRVV
jgi:p24 family protein beta-1